MMKKIFLILTATLLISITQNSFAQKSFEGTVVYAIEYEDLPEEMEAMKAMLPSETITKYKGSKTRTEQSLAGMGTTVSIYDGKTNASITLMDLMGNKVAIRTTADKAKKEGLDIVDIKYLGETKEIAGYTCKKAEITIKGEEETVIVYYTDEINVQQTKSQYKGLKGFPMYFEVNSPEMKMVMTVNEVRKEKISSAEFTIPSDYQEMTEEEFQKQMGAGVMGG